jgi:PilZ domain
MATMFDHAPARHASFTERRRAPRIEIVGQVQGHVDAAGRPVVIRDIGFGGFSVESREPFQIGSVHDFRLTLEDGPSALVRARAVYGRAEPTGAHTTGFELLTEQPQGRGPALDAIIDRLTSVLSWEDA